MPIPQTLMPELTAQFEAIKKLHDADLAAGYAGVFLDDQLEKKYPRADKDFVWQWFFPQQSLTLVKETKERRRYHLYEGVMVTCPLKTYSPYFVFCINAFMKKCCVPYQTSIR